MTEYKFTANYKPKEQPIVISFDELHKELYDKGWTVHWEFNGGTIDPALLKYNNCVTCLDCREINPNVATDVDENGAWNYRLDNLKTCTVYDEESGTTVGLFLIDEGNTPNTSLVSFNVDLPNLTDGSTMFFLCSNLTTFNGDLSNLSACYLMFAGCPKLKSFTSDLSSLTMTMFMFGGNYETVESFVYDIVCSGDTSGISTTELKYMIEMYLQMVGSPTSLDIASVQNIADTINDITDMTPPADLDDFEAVDWGRIDIGIDPTLKGNSDIEAALTTIRNKGWNVTPMYGSDSTYVPTPGEGLLKYNNCRTYAQCKAVDANIAMDIDENGAWNYRLDNLSVGGGFDLESDMVVNAMFRGCSNLTAFSVNLPNLTNGSYMFYGTGLTSWNIPLPNLTRGGKMFYGCTNLTEWNTPLPNLTNGSSMFQGCTGLTSFSVDLPNLTRGGSMFEGTSLTSFNSDLSKLTDGSSMFEDCTGLTSFSVDLPNLTSGFSMFYGCTGLTSFRSDLSSLLDGWYMFQGCTGLTSFSGDLSKLSNGIHMFQGCTGLTSWNIPLPNLTRGGSMFSSTGLTSWNIPLPKLADGDKMFNRCTNLTSFSSDLSSLIDGYHMFGFTTSDCTKLDLASVQNIANTINDLTDKTSNGNEGWGEISIGIQAALKDTTELETALAAIRAKGWTVTEMYA